MKSNSWIIVADQRHAKIFKLQKRAKLKPVRFFDSKEFEHFYTFTDKPGRSKKRRSLMVYTLDKNMRQKNTAEKHFFKSVLNFLDKEYQKKSFEHLYVIAEPKALGEIRKATPAPLKTAIVKTKEKNLVKEDQMTVYEATETMV